MPTISDISPQEWQKHRQDIEELYQNMTLNQVREEMERRGFHAKNGQYSRQLRKWGSKKYRRAADWDHIARTVQHRSRQGKSSAVFIDDERVPSPKVRKEIGRVPLSRLQAIERTPTPIDSIAVQTPCTSLREQSVPTFEFLSSQASLPTTSQMTQLPIPSSPSAKARVPEHIWLAGLSTSTDQFSWSVGVLYHAFNIANPLQQALQLNIQTCIFSSVVLAAPYTKHYTNCETIFIRGHEVDLFKSSVGADFLLVRIKPADRGSDPIPFLETLFKDFFQQIKPNSWEYSWIDSELDVHVGYCDLSSDFDGAIGAFFNQKVQAS